MFPINFFALGFLLAAVWACHKSIARLRLKNRMLEKNCEAAPSLQPWLPFFGIDFLAAKSREITKRNWLDFSKSYFTHPYLKTFQLNLLNKSILFTLDPENIKIIHATNSRSWGIPPVRQQRVAPLIGDGVFTKNGADWAHSRKLLRPSFERSQLNDLSFLETHVQDLLLKVPRNGSPVDLQGLFNTLTMRTAGEFLLGDQPGDSSSLQDEFSASFDRCLSKVGGAGTFMAFAKRTDLQYERDRRLVHDLINHRIQQALDDKGATSRTGRRKFLDELVLATQDKTELRSELLNNLMAARDTTASTLTNVFFDLSKRPAVWQKLQSEIHDKLNGAKPSYSQLQDLPYLSAVLNESWRMFPQVVENGRVALEDTLLPTGGGKDGKSPIFVPKSQVVMWSTYVLHRQKDIYGFDADEFVPERWLPEENREPLKPGFGYIPFGAGARLCMGKQFATAQTAYVTARLVQTFSHIKSASEQPWTESLGVIASLDGGCPVVLS